MTLTWEVAAAAVAIFCALGGIAVKWITSTVEQEAKARAVSAQSILDSQTDLKDDLKALSEGFEKRVDRLEREARDYRPGASIDAAIDHSKRNILTVVDGVRVVGEKNSAALDTLRDRVTVLETKHGAMSVIVSEIKSELKETRHEINDRFDQMAKASQSQFDQLCTTIREMSERKPKS